MPYSTAPAHDVEGLDEASALAISTPRGPFHALQFGPRSGPLVLALHGFPDTPHGLAPVAVRLAGAGYRVVAPYLRGYAPSPLSGPFDVDSLADDALALADALSPHDPPVLLGHDWGATITHSSLSRNPGRFRAGIALAVPHPLAFLRALALDPRQLASSWYMLFFQLPAAPEALVSAGHFAFVDRLWRSWSPSLEAPALHLARVKRCLAESLPGPLELYRALFRPVLGTARRARRVAREPISAPLLALQGDDDGCIAPSSARGQAAFFKGPFRERLVHGAGHFMALERPGEVTREVLGWLSELPAAPAAPGTSG